MEIGYRRARRRRGSARLHRVRPAASV